MAQLTRQLMDCVRCVCVEHYSGFHITNMATHSHGVLILYYIHCMLTSIQHRTSTPPSRCQVVDIVNIPLFKLMVLRTATLNAVTVHMNAHNFLNLVWKKITAYSLLVCSRWVWHVARMGDRRGACMVLVGRSDGKRPL